LIELKKKSSQIVPFKIVDNRNELEKPLLTLSSETTELEEEV